MPHRVLFGLLSATLGFSAALNAPAAHAAPGDTNGPILVNNSYKSELRSLIGELVATVTSDFGTSTQRGEFSPTGDRIAHTSTECVDDMCSSQTTSIVIRHHEGPVLELGPLATEINSISWSPDGQQIAFLATETFDDATIYRLPLNGGDPVALVSDSSSFDVDDFSEISWSPSGGSILFVGGEPEPEGHFRPAHFSQLYTVPTDGGAPQRFNVHYPEECSYETVQTCSFQFQSPEWSPDGTKAVVEVVEELSVWGPTGDERYLGVISSGSQVPTKVAELRELEDGITTWRGPSWSPDGTKLLFQDGDNDGFHSATAQAGGGGRSQLPAALTYLHDWQPCPNGVCPQWGSTRIPTSLSLTASPAGTCTPTGCVAKSVTVRGAISPALKVPVKLRLQARKGGRWVLVAKTGVTTNATGAFSHKFGKPGGSPCRITAAYAGSATHAPSTTRKKFPC